MPLGHIEDGFRLGLWVSNRRSKRRRLRLDHARIAQLEALPGWSWEPITDFWSAGLAALRAFVAREGHPRVPRGHVEAGVRLGSWANSRRAERRRGDLDPARSAELEAIPGWSWDPRADDWDAGLAALRAFVAREGHARVPSQHVEGGLRLGLWVGGRRADHKRGHLDPTRAAALQTLPGWRWDALADGWAVGLAALGAFVAREGHARVPAVHVEGGFRLGIWASHQRGQRRRGALEPARIAELEAIPGWSWEPTAEDWAAALAALRAMAARDGRLRVPRGHVEGDIQLGSWVSSRRAEHRRGVLEPARVAELEAIPGWSWDPRSTK